MRPVVETLRGVVRNPPLQPAAAPKKAMSNAELKDLAHATLVNTDKTLKAFKNELTRMAGRVVDADHEPVDGRTFPDYAAQYSLINIPVPTLAESPPDSNTVSSISGSNSCGE